MTITDPTAAEARLVSLAAALEDLQAQATALAAEARRIAQDPDGHAAAVLPCACHPRHQERALAQVAAALGSARGRVQVARAFLEEAL